MRTADLKPHFLQNAGHAVADGGRGRKGKIDNAKRRIEPAARLLRDELTHARDAERRFLHGLRHHVERLALDALQRVIHNARPGNADVDHFLRLAHAVERARHEGVILYRIAEDHKLGAAKAALLFRERRRLFHRLPHQGDGVHVDSRLGRADIDRRAHKVRTGQRLGDRSDQLPIGVRHALLHKRRKTANKVNTDIFGRAVKRLGKRDIVFRLRRGGDQRDGCDGNPLIDDGNAKFPLDLFSRCDQMLCIAADLVVDLFTRTLRAAVRAGEERDAHRDRADIQMLLVDHTDCFQNIIAA